MDRIIKYGLLLSTFFLLCTSCSAEQPIKEETSKTEEGALSKGEKILIIYLSRTKNTKAVAEIIHSTVGGDLVALEVADPYPGHYQTMVDQVAAENSRGYLPPLKTKIDSMDKYDIIFIGFPTWGMQLPPPMKSFLNKYNLTGKTVIPFNTNAGYGVGSSFETVIQRCPNSKVLEGYTTQGGKERDGILYVMEGDKEKTVKGEVQSWLKKIGFNF